MTPEFEERLKEDIRQLLTSTFPVNANDIARIDIDEVDVVDVFTWGDARIYFHKHPDMGVLMPGLAWNSDAEICNYHHAEFFIIEGPFNPHE